ncbi:hypothetical protein KSW81_005876 [Nannochloris sp. 'desiccata']|nr:hypothetical protein KSW81_005876 [Chlorella desiccata (nom. nud.)]
MTKVWVGNLLSLGSGVSSREIIDVFAKFGPLSNVDLTLGRSNKFDAHEAVKELENNKWGFRVEISVQNAGKEREDGEIDHGRRLRRGSRSENRNHTSRDLRDDIHRGRSVSPRPDHRDSRDRRLRRHRRRSSYSSDTSNSRRSRSRSITPPRTNRYSAYWHGRSHKQRSPSISSSGGSSRSPRRERRGSDDASGRHRQNNRRSNHGSLKRIPSPKARSTSPVVVARSPKARSPLPRDSEVKGRRLK